MSEPISDDELHRILQDASVPGTVSMLRPLELYLNRKWIQELVRESLQRLQSNRHPQDETPTQRKDAVRAIQQRVDFLSWLQRQPDDELYMALYPVSEDGLSEDDLDDLLEDFPGPQSFD